MVSSHRRRMRISEIDQEIARLQAERQALLDSPTLSVDAVPVEIISQIFLACLSDLPFAPGEFDLVAVLSHSLATDGKTSLKRLVEGVDLWLSCSQSRPLSHHRRWKSMELNVPLTGLRDLAGTTGGLLHLTHLLLGSAYYDWGAGPEAGHDAEEPITLFAVAPRLRNLHLVLEIMHHLGRPDHVQLPYGQLTSFTGTSFSVRECLEILAKTPSLVDCVFYVHANVNLVALPFSLRLSRLKSLKLFTTGSQPYRCPVMILNNLTLPALETLVLGREDGTEPEIIESFPLTAQKSLQAMPTLATLTLLEWDEQDVVHALSLLDDDVRLGDMSQGTGIFIPELQSLTIQCEKRDNGCDEEFSYNTLLRLLDMMSARPTPLHSFRLVWTSSL
ncbi:hypothetical protein DFH08DRAFT_1016834 [Mycena albidolilacea]|uniref:F-box domain-containing protein n=1 Tax=Mycena albidolilacea TaxID=1033008 RepID=A0AAD7AP82_9AGAR|nr:hypothetical protein DFH08DRAFT_1016834 [Mycena albidolilacea]